MKSAVYVFPNASFVILRSNFLLSNLAQASTSSKFHFFILNQDVKKRNIRNTTVVQNAISFVKLREERTMKKRPGSVLVAWKFQQERCRLQSKRLTVDSLYLELSRDREICSRQRKFEIQKILHNEQFSEDLTQYVFFNV